MPREIAECDDFEKRLNWFRENRGNGVFAFEEGTEHIEGCVYCGSKNFYLNTDPDYDIIKEVYIPDSVTTLDRYAFCSRMALESV